MNHPFCPSPVGQEFCNKFGGYKPKVIHKLSTIVHLSVDNPKEFIHRPGGLSTETVDKPLNLWITLPDLLSFRDLNDYTTIKPVDKPVDKRGETCG